MPSFEERINDGINKGIVTPIWKNESATFDKIEKIFLGHDYGEHKGIRYGRLFKMGYNWINEKTGGRIDCGMACISLNNGEISYSIKSKETGYMLLAKLSQEHVNFPLYGTNTMRECSDRFKKTGEIPLSEVKGTVIETIETAVREHPIMGKYADLILGDFNNILSLDPEREIEQIPEEALINATLQEDNQRKDAKITRLQEMLNKTLEFAKNVRDSVVGKIFFKNKIAQLNLSEKEIEEGDNTGR